MILWSTAHLVSILSQKVGVVWNVLVNIRKEKEGREDGAAKRSEVLKFLPSICQSINAKSRA